MRAALITRRARLLTLAASAAVAATVALPASGAGSGSSPGQQVGVLKRENSAIAAHARAAVLTLYALDSRLARAEAQLASLRSRAAAVERRRAEARDELRIAKQVFSASQRHLANRLRTAYEEGDSDPLAIVLGARTLDDALSALETAKAAAATDRAVVARARRSRDRYRALQRELAARAEKLRRLEATVSASARALAAAKSERIAYLRQLAAERSLNTRQIGTLESRAQAIEAQARRVAVEETVSPSAPSSSAPVASAPAPTSSGNTLTVTATAYTLQGQTATGAPVGYGVVAVDPSVIPLGTRMTIPGYGEGVAADTGGAIQGSHIDLWFSSEAEAMAWGRRNVTVAVGG